MITFIFMIMSVWRKGLSLLNFYLREMTKNKKVALTEGKCLSHPSTLLDFHHIKFDFHYIKLNIQNPIKHLRWNVRQK